MKLYRLLIAVAMISFVLTGRQAQAQAVPATLDDLFDLDLTNALYLESNTQFSKDYDKFSTNCKPENDGGKLKVAPVSPYNKNKCFKLYRKLQAKADAILNGDEEGSSRGETYIMEAPESDYQTCIENADNQEAIDMCGTRYFGYKESVQKTKRWETSANLITDVVGLGGSIASTINGQNKTYSYNKEALRTTLTGNIANGTNNAAPTTYYYNAQALGAAYKMPANYFSTLNNYNLPSLMASLPAGMFSGSPQGMYGSQYGSQYGPQYGSPYGMNNAYNPMASLQGIASWGSSFDGNQGFNNPYAGNNTGRQTGNGGMRMIRN